MLVGVLSSNSYGLIHSAVYMVTCIVVNDFESENVYVVNFINRQTSYHSIGMTNKIIWRKYYTDSCSATTIILNSVATPKNCTITRRQRYFKTVRRLNISTEQCFLFLMTAFSLSRIEPMRFWRVVKEIDLRLWAGINSSSHNAPNVFNRRWIWRIWRPVSRWNVMSNVVLIQPIVALVFAFKIVHDDAWCPIDYKFPATTISYDNDIKAS